MLGEVDDHARRHPDFDWDGLVDGVLLVVDGRFDLGERHPEGDGQTLHHCRIGRGDLSIERDDGLDLVRHEDLATPCLDQPSRRLDRHVAGNQALHADAGRGAVEDLKGPQPEHHDREQREHEDAHHRQAQPDADGLAPAGLLSFLFLQALQGAGRRAAALVLVETGRSLDGLRRVGRTARPDRPDVSASRWALRGRLGAPAARAGVPGVRAVAPRWSHLAALPPVASSRAWADPEKAQPSARIAGTARIVFAIPTTNNTFTSSPRGMWGWPIKTASPA